MSQTPAAAPQVSGKMFLFEKPELINAQQHGNLGLAQSDKPFSFCAKVRAVPLTLNEFPLAMKRYPIIFSNAEEMMPLAVLGVVDDVNLFVNEDGGWEEKAYIPAYIRRYPFALATDSKDTDRMALVVDRASKWVKEGGEMPLFQNGQPTEAMTNAVEFCKQCEGERRATDQSLAKLKEFDLVQGQTAQYTPQGGEPRTFAQYFGVDERKLIELPADRFEALRQTGLLPFIYAHLMSFSNWRELMGRRSQRFGIAEDKLFDPLPLN